MVAFYKGEASMAAFALMTIAGLADKTGIEVATIRSYERLGLIPKPRRVPGGHVLYRGEDVEVLRFIGRARELGFSMDAIAELVTLSDGRQKGHCKQVHDLALRQLTSIRARLEELGRMEQALAKLADCCQQQSYDPTRCPLLKSLSQPD